MNIRSVAIRKVPFVIINVDDDRMFRVSPSGAVEQNISNVWTNVTATLSVNELFTVQKAARNAFNQ